MNVVDYRTWNVTEQDPPGSEWDMYALPIPDGDWSYVIDYSAVIYRRYGWPFGDSLTLAGHSYRDWRSGDPEPAPKPVRLSPDTKHYAWRNEYVLMDHGRLDQFKDEERDQDWAHASLTLWVRPCRSGGIVVPNVYVEFDLRDDTYQIVACPDVLRAQAEMKAGKLLAFLVEHRRLARRRNRSRVLVTAAMLAEAREVQP